MTKINLEQLLNKPYSKWKDNEKIFFLNHMLEHYNGPLPGYVETMLDRVIYSEDDRNLHWLGGE